LLSSNERGSEEREGRPGVLSRRVEIPQDADSEHRQRRHGEHTHVLQDALLDHTLIGVVQGAATRAGGHSQL
jgi:hypothetical protein